MKLFYYYQIGNGFIFAFEIIYCLHHLFNIACAYINFNFSNRKGWSWTNWLCAKVEVSNSSPWIAIRETSALSLKDRRTNTLLSPAHYFQINQCLCRLLLFLYIISTYTYIYYTVEELIWLQLTIKYNWILNIYYCFIVNCIYLFVKVTRYRVKYEIILPITVSRLCVYPYEVAQSNLCERDTSRGIYTTRTTAAAIVTTTTKNNLIQYRNFDCIIKLPL